MYQILFGIMLSILFLGCRQHLYKQSSLTEAFDRAKCDEGEPYSFYLKPINPMPETPMVVFTKWEHLKMNKIPPDQKNQFQLEVCSIDHDQVVLKNIKYLNQGLLYQMTVEEKAEIQGLAAALFGDYSKLYVKVPIISETTNDSYRYLLRGWTDGKSSFVTAGPIRVRDNFDSPVSIDIMTGKLEPGVGAFPDMGPCSGNGESMNEGMFQIGTAHFKVKYCSWMTMENSQGIRVYWASLEDDNKALAERLKIEFKEPSDFAGENPRFAYNWTHHNFQDTLLVKLDNAQYFAQKTGSVIMPSTSTIYSFRYGTEPEQTGEYPCDDIFHCLRD